MFSCVQVLRALHLRNRLAERTMDEKMNNLCSRRNHLRSQFVEGRSLKKVPFADDTWYKENDAKLLDVHFQCDEKRALEDAFYMICTEKPRITVKERRSAKKKDADQQDHKRSKLEPCELQIIQEWYDKNVEDWKADARETLEYRVHQQIRAGQMLAGQAEIKQTTKAIEEITTAIHTETVNLMAKSNEILEKIEQIPTAKKRQEIPSGQWAIVKAPPEEALFLFNTDTNRICIFPERDKDEVNIHKLVPCFWVRVSRGTLEGDDFFSYILGEKESRPRVLCKDDVLKWSTDFVLKCESKVAGALQRFKDEQIAGTFHTIEGLYGWATFGDRCKRYRVYLKSVVWQDFRNLKIENMEDVLKDEMPENCAATRSLRSLRISKKSLELMRSGKRCSELRRHPVDKEAPIGAPKLASGDKVYFISHGFICGYATYSETYEYSKVERLIAKAHMQNENYDGRVQALDAKQFNALIDDKHQIVYAWHFKDFHFFEQDRRPKSGNDDLPSFRSRTRDAWGPMLPPTFILPEQEDEHPKEDEAYHDRCAPFSDEALGTLTGEKSVTPAVNSECASTTASGCSTPTPIPSTGETEKPSGSSLGPSGGAADLGTPSTMELEPTTDKKPRKRRVDVENEAPVKRRRSKRNTFKKFARKVPGAFLRQLSEAMRAAAEVMEPKK